MELIKAKINENDASMGIKSFRFDEHDKNFDKVLEICQKCKFFDGETDFPNMFCDKCCEMIDYWYCLSQCPLGKFKLVDDEEK